MPAVFVDKTTKVITQGFTGKNGTFHSEQVGGREKAPLSTPLPLTRRHDQAGNKSMNGMARDLCTNACLR